MKKNCKPGKFGLRMAMGGMVPDITKNKPYMAPTAPTPVGVGSMAPGQVAGGGTDKMLRPAVTPAFPTAAPQPTQPAVGRQMDEGPSALEQRLNSRLAAGTLTVRGADMLRGVEDSRRTDLTNRYGFDTRSADNRYSTDAQTQSNILNNQTQLHGINTQAASNQYNTDAQTQNNILNNQTQLHGINTQAASNQYNTDAQTQNNILNNQTQMFGHRTNAAADRYRTDSQADTSRYSTDVGAQTQLQQSQNQMLSNMYITDANNYAASIGNRSRPYGLRNGGEIHAANGFAQYTPRGFGAERIQNYNMDLGLSNFGLAQQLQDYNIGMGRDEFWLRSQNQAEQLKLAQAGNSRAQQLQDYNIGMGRDEFGLRSQIAKAGDARAQQLQDYNIGMGRDEFVLNSQNQAEQLKLAQAGSRRAQQLQDYNIGMGRDEFGLRSQIAKDSMARGRDDFGLRKQNQVEQLKLAQSSDARAQQLQDYNIGMGRDEFGLRSQNQAEQLKLAQAGDVRTQQLHEANLGYTREDRQTAKELMALRLRQEQADRSMQHQRDFDAAELLKRNEGRLMQDRADMRQQQHMADYNMRDSQKFMREQIGLMNERIDARKPVAFRSNGAPRYGFGLRNGGEIRAATGYEYLVPDAPERVPGWIQEFNAKNRGTYVGRDKVKANEYAVAKRNAETTDRMANGGAYPGAISLEAQRNPYKRVADLENMYDDAGYNPYTGVHDPSKKGWGAQWVASSKYRMRNGGEIHAAKGGIWGAIKGAVGMGDSDEEFAAKMNKGETEQKQADLAAAHAARLKREGGTWGGSGGEAARTVPTSTGKSFDGVSMQTKRSLREHGLLANGGTLQTGQGGAVPGTGKGDKIPAKYEPGEFVVSNDMLAAEPELRDHLRALREQVLAAKGMTPEEADAKAIQGAGDKRQMRARFGADEPGGLPRGLFNFGMEPELTEEEIARRTMAEMDAKARQMPAEGTKEFRGPEEPIASRRERNFNLTPTQIQEIESAENAKNAHGAAMRAQAAARNAPPATNAATPAEMATAFDSRSNETKPSAKDTPAVLQGATGKDVGFGITRFNVPGQSPLFTNMTDEEGMRSNDALISRKPQSDQDRIAGDNLSNRFAQRADAEARMAQRQAELQAEYERGQVDNRAIASSERQRELLNEQRNLERKIPRQEEAAGVNARIAALEKARLGEGENFGARENALVLDQARNAATIGVHAGDRASIERVADKELAAKSPGYALDNELSRQKIAAAQELKSLRDEYSNTSDPAKKAAIAERVRWLTGGKAEGGDHFGAQVITDENGKQSLATWDKRSGRAGPAGGGQGNRQATKEQVIAAANAKGITDPAALQQLFKHYGVE